MANTSKLAVTNVTVSTKTVPITELSVVSNYAKVEDEPTVCTLSNKTCPLDQGELVTYRAVDIPKVSATQRIQNPSKVKNGIQYIVKVEEILRTKDANDNIICDEPIVAYISIRHQKSGNITEAMVQQTLSRLNGALYKLDGTSRIGDLMRSALVPVKD